MLCTNCTQIVSALLQVCNCERLSELQTTFTQIHKWNKSCTLINSGKNTNILVTRPPNSIGDKEVDDNTIKQQVTYYLERVFADLLAVAQPGPDYNKKGHCMLALEKL